MNVTDPLTPIALDGPWTVRLEQDGAVATERPLGSWTTFAPTFSGSAVYTTTVTLTAADLARRKLILDLGEVHDLATATVNGAELPAALWHPYTVDATTALRPGVNTISVRVTNTLANSRNKILASGLVGPVALRPRAALTARLEATR
ncbi:glycosylhydrolase-like jelly roll fold domain-containing protein [Amycolatopsis nalaikhensis]|uniref:glycosylhydrolase-like jelly roll fold domain-containing protein n=1 Tax=Amycolatopsis nalaikhensis TaxID=715472 RepID=UPI00332DA89C